MRKLLLCLLVCLSFASVVGAQAQTRLLQPNQPVSGVIDDQHLAQTYLFTTHSPAAVGVSITNRGDIPLAALVYDTGGQTVLDAGQIPAQASGGFTNWQAPADGTYYLLILPAEAPAGRQGSFDLTLIPSAAAAPVAAGSGTLQVILTWQDAARLSLEVRDPGGQSVHWRNPQTSDGGSFFGNTDPIDCANFAPHTQTQTVSWSSGTLPTGSYEILVHYLDGCTTDSIPFSLNGRYGQTTYPAVNGAVQPGDTFVTGFVVSGNTRPSDFTGRTGVVNANTTLPFATADLSAAAQPLPASGSADGHISRDQPFSVFSFTGQLGTSISAEVTHTSGSLDTILLLMDTNGNIIAANDDRADGVTNSAIGATRLPRNGTYLLIVTRYAFAIGATEGDFSLTVGGAGS